MSYIMTGALPLPKNRSQARALGSSHPFLEYASTYVLDHAEKAEAKNVGQARFLQWLGKEHSTFERMRLFHNSFEENPDSRCVEGVNLLYMSAVHGYSRLAEVLLQKGTNVDAQGGYFGTALQAAAAEGKDKIVAMLLNYRADVNAQGGHFNTALQAAAAEGKDNIVAMLLSYRADVSAQVEDVKADGSPAMLDTPEKEDEYADSDRSSGASTLWSALNSEGSSAVSAPPSGIIRQELADVILVDAGLATTPMAAKSHPSFQSDDVLEEFKRLMGYYYRDLKKSSTTSDHNRVARLFKKSSGLITHEARKLLGLVHAEPLLPDLRAKMNQHEKNEMLQYLLDPSLGPVGRHQETGTHDDATGEEDDNEDERDFEDDAHPEISAAVAFLKDGIPMQKFQANLRKFVLDAVWEHDVLRSPRSLPCSLPNIVDDIWC